MINCYLSFKRKIDFNNQPLENEVFLKLFEDNLRLNRITEITKTSTSLTFKNNFFILKPKGNWNIWPGISDGEIIINENTHEKYIRYKINIIYFFIVSVIMSVFFGVGIQFIKVSLIQSLVVGVIVLIVTSLLAVLITYIRHDDHLSEMIKNTINFKVK